MRPPPQKGVIKMKRFLTIVACLICATAVAGPANATFLGPGDLIGTIVDGVPAGDPNELAYVQALITNYNSPGGPITGAVGAETWTLYHDSPFFGNTLPAPIFGFKDDESPFFNIDLTGTSYLYLFAKYGGGQVGGYSALYYLDSYTLIEGINPTVPVGATAGLGLSHVVLWNPTQVPEAGALLMFGTGLIGLVGYRRVRRMQ